MPALSLRELQDQARHHLDPAVYDFVAGGAADEVTMRANQTAFTRIGLLPRVLRGSHPRDLAVTLLGRHATQPIIVRCRPPRPRA
jgi:4-hydroxymandelate oxidase